MPRQALQLYTLREFMKTADSVRTSLQRVRAIGYTAIQLSAVEALNVDLSPLTLSEWLSEMGIQCIATHRPWEALATDTHSEIEFHKILGCDYVAIAGIPNGYHRTSSADYRRFVEDSAAVRLELAASGVRFGHHNHAFEFDRGPNGACESPWEALILQKSANYYLELDVYWAWHAGINPVALFKQSLDRVPVVHIKDRAVLDGEPSMCPIGEGNLPWNEIIPAGNAAGVAWWCVEQDTCSRDPFDSITSSYTYLSNTFGLQ